MTCNQDKHRIIECVFVVGGGRWSRVILGIINNLLPMDVSITLITKRYVDVQKKWVKKQGFRHNIFFEKELPKFFGSDTTLVIIANAANDHVKTGLVAIKKGASAVLIEKPFAMSSVDAELIYNYSKKDKCFVCAANVMSFAKYFINFSRLIPPKNKIQSVNFEWVDPKGDWRYGEAKTYDSSVPVFVDCLPHVMTIMQIVFGEFPELNGHPTVEFNGSKITLPMNIDGKSCSIIMQRNGFYRKRKISVLTDDGLISLDFSIEPGIITNLNKKICADNYWEESPSPLTLMLDAFIVGASSGVFDPRLGLDVAFATCNIVDKLKPEYNSIIISQLYNSLTSSKNIDEFTEYAINELFQIRGKLSPKYLQKLRIEFLKFKNKSPKLSLNHFKRYLEQIKIF